MTTMEPESLRSGDAEYNDFVLAYGQAIFAWQDIETELFKLYHTLCVRLGKNDVMEASRQFYGRASFGPKLNLVSKVANKAQIESMIRWDALNANLRHKSQDRNVLAHHPPCRYPKPNGLGPWELCRQQFALMEIIDIWSLGKRYDAVGLRGLCQDFELLALRIAEATKTVNRRESM